MSDLSLSAYASATGTHVVRRPSDARFHAFVDRFDEAAERARLAAAGLRFVGRSDAGFPPLLRAIHDPPPGLYLRGNGVVELLTRSCVAIVGARACSGYGRAVARSLARELAASGLVVVSGLARGIDGEAHRGALEGGGPTVAVLGCGVDRDYPAAHAELARRVCAEGVVVSEYGPGVEPAPWRFPARNRIIAGLAEATVVVEARERSGALITADFALEEGRDVLAVPGEITASLSVGTNALLRLGATPLLGAADVLGVLGIEVSSPAPVPVEGDAATVLEQLAAGPAVTDELVRATGLDAGVVAGALTELELSGLVSQDGGVYRSNIGA
jgi:DNA processing protein